MTVTVLTWTDHTTTMVTCLNGAHSPSLSSVVKWSFVPETNPSNNIILTSSVWTRNLRNTYILLGHEHSVTFCNTEQTYTLVMWLSRLLLALLHERTSRETLNILMKISSYHIVQFNSYCTWCQRWYCTIHESRDWHTMPFNLGTLLHINHVTVTWCHQTLYVI